MPRRAQSTLLVQEVMEEEWHALQSMERCPEALSQVRLGSVFQGGCYSTSSAQGPLCTSLLKSSEPTHPPASSQDSNHL